MIPIAMWVLVEIYWRCTVAPVPPGCAFVQIISREDTMSVSAVREVEAALNAIDHWNPSTRAMLTVLGEDARDAAEQLDKRQADGEWCGLLAGMTLSLKDNIDMAGVVTTAGSKLLASNRVNDDAFIVSRLKRAGAVIVGKANLHEWVFGPTSQSPQYGPVRNPWDTDRIPGGSSGGSGAALASGMCVGSIGSDTGGSVRLPSAFCGVAGLRPTIGRISCRGSVPVSRLFDTLGPMAKRVSDVARIFSVVAGHDPEDPISQDVPVPNVVADLDRPVEGMRIGVQRRWFFENLDTAVSSAMDDAIRTFTSLGCEIVEVELGDVERCQELFAFKVLLADAYEVHKDRLQSHPDGYSRDVYTRAMLGKEVAGWEYAAAMRWNEAFQHRLRATFDTVDAILSPTIPFGAPEAQTGQEGEEWFSTIREITRYTYCWSFPGVPALSVPCGQDANGMPVALQLATRWFRRVDGAEARARLPNANRFPPA
jgi:aspartyl-tRNA(Asn)/glutamyl-tRNA(Gln) amidotransferase subunit A